MILITIMIREMADGKIAQLIQTDPQNPTEKEKNFGALLLAAIENAEGRGALLKSVEVKRSEPLPPPSR